MRLYLGFLSLMALVVCGSAQAQESLTIEPISSVRPEAITDIPIAPASDGGRVESIKSSVETSAKTGVKEAAKAVKGLEVKAKDTTKKKSKSVEKIKAERVVKAQDHKAFKSAVAKAKVKTATTVKPVKKAVSSKAAAKKAQATSSSTTRKSLTP